MHTYHHTFAVKRSLARTPKPDAFRILLILAVFAATSAGLSVLDKDHGVATQPSAQAAAIEDWHGNVARSGK